MVGHACRLEATHASPVERELCQQAQAVLELLAKVSMPALADWVTDMATGMAADRLFLTISSCCCCRAVCSPVVGTSARQDKASITGVNGLLESLELLVVMDRRVQRIKDQALQHPEDERAAAALREAARDFDHVYQQMRKHGQGGDVLSLLGSHLGVLERGLRERLGYEVSDDSAQVGWEEGGGGAAVVEQEGGWADWHDMCVCSLQAYERQKRRRTVITAVLGAAAAGLALGPLVTMLAAAWGKDAR